MRVQVCHTQTAACVRAATACSCLCVLARTDGYVRGETCICTVLTTAGGAETLGRAATVVVAGSAVNQDGRSSSLTAPNGPAQQEVVRAALAAAGLAAAGVAALSMHGTGTPLGDPIEVGAALAVCATPERQLPLVLAASKSWVGHAEPAAGLAGLLFAKHVGQQRHSLALLHLRTVNPYVASALEEASHPTPALLSRQAGGLPTLQSAQLATAVSAFAFQGTNAHVLLATPSQPAALPAGTAALAWQRKWQYVVPEPHLLIATAEVVAGAPHQRRVQLAVSLSAAQLAYVWEHQVMGKSILPGALLDRTRTAARTTTKGQVAQEPVDSPLSSCCRRRLL